MSSSEAVVCARESLKSHLFQFFPQKKSEIVCNQTNIICCGLRACTKADGYVHMISVTSMNETIVLVITSNRLVVTLCVLRGIILLAHTTEMTKAFCFHTTHAHIHPFTYSFDINWKRERYSRRIGLKIGSDPFFEIIIENYSNE